MNYYLITDVNNETFGAVGADEQHAIANLVDMIGEIEIDNIVVSDKETVSDYF